MGQVLEIVGESSSKSKTAGSICIRWKIRKKLGELPGVATTGRFKVSKLEIGNFTSSANGAVHVGRLKGPLFTRFQRSPLPWNLRGKPIPRRPSPIQLSESGLKSWDSFPTTPESIELSSRRKGNGINTFHFFCFFLKIRW